MDDCDWPDFGTETATEPAGLTLDDFYAFMPMHNYIYAPCRAHWPGASVNARLPPVPILDAKGLPKLKDGKPMTMTPTQWLDQNQPVEQMTWAPGLPLIIRHKLILKGGWISKPGASVFNLYRPPEPLLGGDPAWPASGSTTSGISTPTTPTISLLGSPIASNTQT